MLTKSETVHGKHLWHQMLNLDLWSEAGCDVTPVAKYNEVAKPPWQRSWCYWQMWPPSPRGRRIHTYIQRCICFTIQMLLGTSLRESRKLDLYDVEIQLPTNPKWTVAPYRGEKEVVSAGMVPSVLGWVVCCFDICMCWRASTKSESAHQHIFLH